MVLAFIDSLGRNMGKPRRCLLCRELFSPSGVRAKYCPRCNPLAVKLGGVCHAMRSRCKSRSPQDKCYRTVAIDLSWLGACDNFILWASKNGYRAGLELDRIDTTKGYGPNNCRFGTRLENARNRRNVVTNFVKRTRRCTICHSVKHFSAFHKTRSCAAGITYECRDCKRIKDKIRNSS